MANVMAWVDLKKVQTRLSGSSGRLATETDVRFWLLERGFLFMIDGWVAEASALDALDPCEYLVLDRYAGAPPARITSPLTESAR